MKKLFKKGDQSPEIKQIQTLLVERGFLTNEEVSGVFDNETFLAVCSFQTQNLDQNGQPLVVDGKVGELTWWSLHNPKPRIQTPSAVDFLQMPDIALGGTSAGRAALEVAIAEMKDGAGEIGGNNQGRFVRKYLNGLATEGADGPWCAGFVSYCFSQIPDGIPFKYSVGSRDILQQFKKRGWASAPDSSFLPQPGDLVIWWRKRLSGSKGHIGIVHQLRNGFLYTIEGNRSPDVQGFNYVFSRMEKLLGFGRVPD